MYNHVLFLVAKFDLYYALFSCWGWAGLGPHIVHHMYYNAHWNSMSESGQNVLVYTPLTRGETKALVPIITRGSGMGGRAVWPMDQ